MWIMCFKAPHAYVRISIRKFIFHLPNAFFIVASSCTPTMHHPRNWNSLLELSHNGLKLKAEKFSRFSNSFSLLSREHSQRDSANKTLRCCEELEIVFGKRMQQRRIIVCSERDLRIQAASDLDRFYIVSTASKGIVNFKSFLFLCRKINFSTGG
jgi:hypothetical protein